MKLSDCRIGDIVRNVNGQICHITGLMLDPNGETIPVIQAANGSIYGSHPENFMLLSDWENEEYDRG